MAAAAALVGCQHRAAPKALVVEQALGQSRSQLFHRSNGHSEATPPHHPRGSQAGGAPIATVSGMPVTADEFHGLLLKSRGAAVLEQLVGLRLVEAAAAKVGVRASESALAEEYDLSLRQLLSSSTDHDRQRPMSETERHEAEKVLESFLTSRNISRDEYQVVIRRNALLRAMAARDVHLDEAAVEREARKLTGDRVHVRQIQVATLREAQLALDRLRAGEVFEVVARQYSADVPSRDQGGLVAPFSAQDPAVSPALREAAFALQVGAVSEAIRVDPWYFVIQVVARGPSLALSPEAAQEEIRQRLQRRLLPEAMDRLYRLLLEGADIQINDPVLEEAWKSTRRLAGAGSS